MKNKLIKHIETLIKEHEENQYCMDWNEVLDEEDAERAVMLAYDCGRIATLNEILDAIELLENIGE